MKRSHALLLAVSAIALGYSLGTIRNIPREAGDTTHQAKSPFESRGTTFNSSSGDDTLSLAFSATQDLGNLRQLAMLGALLETLDSNQIRALLDRLDRKSVANRDRVLPIILGFWAKRDPKAATAWMHPRLESFAGEIHFGGGGADSDTEIVRAWAENAPQLALEYAKGRTGTGLANIILHNAIFAWPDEDNNTRFQVLLGVPPGEERQKTIVSLCFMWAQKDRITALNTAAMRLTGPEREGALGEILAKWAGHDPMVALEKAKSLGIDDSSALTLIVKSGAKSNPVATARWFETHDPQRLQQVGTLLARFWADQDPVAAFDWSRKHGIPISNSTMYDASKLSKHFYPGHAVEIGQESPFSAALRSKPESTLAWIRSLPAGTERELYIELAFRETANVDDVMPLLSELPEENSIYATKWIVHKLLSKDPARSQQWAESLPLGAQRDAAWAALGASRLRPSLPPPGRDRDAMISGMATARSIAAPLKALDQLLEIGDPNVRRRTFDDVMWNISRESVDLGQFGYRQALPDATKRDVQEWLKNADIPEEWKKTWQR